MSELKRFVIYLGFINATKWLIKHGMSRTTAAENFGNESAIQKSLLCLQETCPSQCFERFEVCFKSIIFCWKLWKPVLRILVMIVARIDKLSRVFTGQENAFSNAVVLWITEARFTFLLSLIQLLLPELFNPHGSQGHFCRPTIVVET